MKRFIISEDEKRRILGLHKSLINEQDSGTSTPLDATQKLEAIQKAFDLNPDVVVGPKTTEAIISKLSKNVINPEETTYNCVISHPYMTKVEMGRNMKPEYEYGDLRFKLDGTYIDSKQPQKRFNYICAEDNDGNYTIIMTNGHGNINKEQHWGSLQKKEIKKTETTTPEPIKMDRKPYEPTFEPIPMTKPESREDLETRQKMEKELLRQREKMAKGLRKTIKKDLRQLPKQEREALKRELRRKNP